MCVKSDIESLALGHAWKVILEFEIWGVDFNKSILSTCID